MQQRRDEILAKKAKLAELKRQRELRAKESSASRQSLSGANSEVSFNSLTLNKLLTPGSLLLQHQGEQIIEGSLIV